MTTLLFENDEYGNPVGVSVSHKVLERPHRWHLNGKWCVLERLTLDHAEALTEVLKGHDQNWIWLPYGPFHEVKAMAEWIESTGLNDDPLFYVVKAPVTGKIMGVLSYLRINPDSRSIEVGHINFAPVMQKTPAATEAVYLMMKAAFDAGYRRFEWKCNVLNHKSCRAAERFGLSFEGVFRAATLSKGRNRDTAWFAATETDWPLIQAAFETWLSADNFTSEGQQISALSDLTRPHLVRQIATSGYQFSKTQSH
jgi:RimJ/RimL family protein N-acetyltransferase